MKEKPVTEKLQKILARAGYGSRRELERWIAAGAPAAETVRKLPPVSQLSNEDRSYWAFQTPVMRPFST